jgi:hypothetical protein
MSADIVYEIVRYDGEDDDASLLERVQLLRADGGLLLRDAGGNETACIGADIAAVFSTTPSLREIHAGTTVRICCAPEIVAQLPFVLQPVRGGGDSSGNYATVNGTSWTAYPTADEDYVMLPGWDEDEEPDMSPCWAEHGVEEGEWNPLIGHTAIGLAVPGVAVEYGWYDHGGIERSSAVSVRRFDDFATVFADWLVEGSVHESLWGGDSAPYSHTVQLFADAAKANKREGHWSTEMDEEDEDETDDNGDESQSHCVSVHLKLYLSDELIDQVRSRLISLDPAYADILKPNGR